MRGGRAQCGVRAQSNLVVVRASLHLHQNGYVPSFELFGSVTVTVRVSGRVADLYGVESL